MKQVIYYLGMPEWAHIAFRSGCWVTSCLRGGVGWGGVGWGGGLGWCSLGAGGRFY